MLKKIVMICAVSAITLGAFAADNSDNSGKNKAQVRNNQLDAGDQSNNKADVELTAKIRKAVVAEKAFSTNAKNIKIITIDGRVTLKGPVNTLNEKNRIHAIATQFVGSGQVNDEIEIVNR